MGNSCFSWFLTIIISLTSLGSSLGSLYGGPCDFQINRVEKIWPSYVLRKCFSTFQFNETEAIEVITTFKKTLNFLPYEDIAIESPTLELPLRIDIQNRLTEIGKARYSSEFAFHNALVEFFDSLRDINLQYIYYCFDMLSEHSFPIVFYFDKNDKPVVQIRTKYANPDIVYKTKSQSIDVTLFNNAIVDEINGKGAYEYLLEYAQNNVGGYKDINARFNSLFVRTVNASTYWRGTFTLRSNMFTDTIKMKVKRVGMKESEDLTVPFFSYFIDGGTRNFSDPKKYFDQYCVQPRWHRKKSFSQLKLFEEKAKASRENLSKQSLSMGISASPLQKSTKLTDGAELLVDGPVSTWVLPGNKTGVLVITSFGMDYGFWSDFEEWFGSATRGLKELKKTGASRLIIDVQDSFNGASTHIDALIQFLFPSNISRTYNLQFKATNLAQRVVKIVTKSDQRWIFSEYSYSLYKDLDGNPMKPEIFFFPVINKTFNGKESGYSQLFKKIDDRTKYERPTVPLFEGENILILTNGLCYDKCAQFVYKAKEYGKVKSVGVGGIPGGQMGVGGGVTGNGVMTLFPFLMFNIYGWDCYDDEEAPPPPTRTMDFSFPLIQSYCDESSIIPTDFIFKPSTFRFSHSQSTVLDKHATWQKAETFFSRETDNKLLGFE